MKVKIGDTPTIKIKYKYNEKEKHIFTKLEYYNFSGSIKDRVAEYIINNAVKMGNLKKGMTIYEASSGNTGISLAAISKIYGYKVHIFMPDWVSKERLDLMKMYNAKVTLISKEDGRFKRAIEEAKKAAIYVYLHNGVVGINEDKPLLGYNPSDKAKKYVDGIDKTRVLNVFNHIPVQLAKENKKFQLSKVASNAKYRDYRGCSEKYGADSCVWQRSCESI